MAHLGHDADGVVYGGQQGEFQQILRVHEVADGGRRLMSLPAAWVSQGTLMMATPFSSASMHDGLAHFGPLADDDKAGLHLDGTELAFIAVGHDDDVTRLWMGVLQQLRRWPRR